MDETRVQAAELRPEYELLNAQFALLKAYKRITPDNEQAWSALIEAACKVPDGLTGPLKRYAVEVSLATLSYLESTARAGIAGSDKAA